MIYSSFAQCEIINLNDYIYIESDFKIASDKAALHHLATSNKCEPLYAKPPVTKREWHTLNDPLDPSNRFQTYCWYLKAASVNGVINISPQVANKWINNNLDIIKYISSVDFVIDTAIEELNKESHIAWNCDLLQRYSEDKHPTALAYTTNANYRKLCSN